MASSVRRVADSEYSKYLRLINYSLISSTYSTLYSVQSIHIHAYILYTMLHIFIYVRLLTAW